MTLHERENFLDYVSHRPGVKSDGDHGLWDANGKVQNLSKAVEEVAHHQGVVWTPVVTIRRADAERLGYTDVENWRAVVNASINEIAEGYKRHFYRLVQDVRFDVPPDGAERRFRENAAVGTLYGPHRALGAAMDGADHRHR